MDSRTFNFGLVADGAPSEPLPPLLADHFAEICDFQEVRPFNTALPSLLDLFQQCHALGQKLLTAFAIALGLPDDFLASTHQFSGSNASILRLLRYPAGPAALRAGSHSDYGSLTLLFLEPDASSAGLQLLPPANSPNDEEAWVDVPARPNAVLVNIEDALECVQW
jgi:isopenicillin N synthase-like dioxygenase